MNIKISLLFLLAVSLSMGWFIYYDDGKTPEATFQLSCNPDEKTEIVLKGKNLLIRNLPKSEGFNYVMLKLVGENGALPAKKCKNKREDKYDVKFNLWDVPNGAYYVEVYSAKENHAAYVSYFRGRSLSIQVNDTNMDFILPPTLTANKEMYDAVPKDESSLAQYLEPSEKVASDHPVIIELAFHITSGASSDYEKVKAVHDWVSGNIWYDYDELSTGVLRDVSVFETLSSKKGVCIDFATLAAALLRAVGIPAKLEAGYVLNMSAQEEWTKASLSGKICNHVWNLAFADGRWIIIDATYDTNNTYKNKTYSTETGMKNRRYFDISIEFLSTDRCIAPCEVNPVENR